MEKIRIFNTAFIVFPPLTSLALQANDSLGEACIAERSMEAYSKALSFQYTFYFVQLVQSLERCEIVHIERQQRVAYLCEDRVVELEE